MNRISFLICAMATLLLSSFTKNLECEYAGSNLGFAKSQTEKALEIRDINKARYYAYKALSAIEKSKKQLAVCGCEYAEEGIEESLIHLRLATKATTLSSARILLRQSLENTSGSLDALEKHDLHDSKYASDVLVLNTKDAKEKTITLKETSTKTLNDMIDISLEKYRKSLNKVVETVDCTEAKTFAKRIFDNCEQQLLKGNISEGKKYYNLRTKEITAEALKRIGECATNKI
ncbi:MAG: hypothetical protein WBB27_01785 [Maribacter sp.]